jgi:tight adherence protein B
MVPAIVVFVVVTGLIVGGYLLITWLPGALKQRQLDRRLREVSAPAKHAVSEDSGLVKTAPDALLDRMAAGTKGGAWLGRLIEQSGVRTTPGTVIFISLGAAVALGLLGFVLSGKNWVALIAGGIGLIAPSAFLMRKRTVRMRQFEEMFPEALDLLSRAVKAGHAFQTAMSMAADELPDPVGPEFKKTFDQQNFGLPLRDALNAMVDRIPIIDVKFFVTAVLIQRETGGNLSEILDNLSHVVRERFKVLRQVRVHTAHGRFTGWVLLALPALLAVALSYINPEHMQLLFDEPLGRTMLIGAAVMQTVGFLWIKHVIKIEV